MCEIKRKDIVLFKSCNVTDKQRHYVFPLMETILDHELKQLCHILDRRHLFSNTTLPTSDCEVIISSSREHGSERQYLPPLHQAPGVDQIMSVKHQHLELGYFGEEETPCAFTRLSAAVAIKTRPRSGPLSVSLHRIRLSVSR